MSYDELKHTIGIPPMKLADGNGENEILNFLEKNIKEIIS